MSDTIERGMFYGATPNIFKKADSLRRNMTESERLLWKRINDKKIIGYRFKAQHPIDIFIADFYCHPLRLVLEIDGEIHNDPERRKYDIGRTAELERFDIKIIRYTNHKVLYDLDYVVADILHQCILRQNEIRDKPFCP